MREHGSTLLLLYSPTLGLNDAWNQVLLPHQGRHANAYHEWIIPNLVYADEIAQGKTAILLDIMRNGVFTEVVENPDILYKDYWKTFK